MSDARLREWAETWARAGVELQAIKRRELQAMSDTDAKEAALDLLSMHLPEDLPTRSGSGLVDQQRWFARIRARK
jgi:hypothetical protein